MTPEQLALLADSRLSPAARILGLHISAAGGEWVELGRDDCRRLLEANAGKDRIARDLSDLVAFGYVERKAGGKGHPDSFRFSVRDPRTLTEDKRPRSPDAKPDSVRDPRTLNPAVGGGYMGGAAGSVQHASSKSAREPDPADPPAPAPEPPPAPPSSSGDHRADCEAFVAAAGYGARERLIAQGEDATAWRDHTGHPVPWEDRLRLLRLADARVRDRTSDNLRSALRYVIPQQYDPAAAPTSAEFADRRPKPGTEHERVRSSYRSETPGEGRAFRREGTGLASLPDLVQANLRRAAAAKAGEGATAEEVERALAELVAKYEQHHGVRAAS